MPAGAPLPPLLRVVRVALPCDVCAWWGSSRRLPAAAVQLRAPLGKHTYPSSAAPCLQAEGGVHDLHTFDKRSW